MISADNGKQMFRGNHLLGTFKRMLEHRARADEINVLFGQGKSFELLHKRTETGAITAPPERSHSGPLTLHEQLGFDRRARGIHR
jgi:hypothetical protein